MTINIKDIKLQTPHEKMGHQRHPFSFNSVINTVFLLALSLQNCRAYAPSYQANEDYSKLSCSLADSMNLKNLLPYCPPSTQCFPVKALENDLASSIRRARLSLKPPSEEDLNSGNKHANLIQMANFVEMLNHHLVTIPRPQAISSPQVMKFLKENAPELFEEWENLQRLNLDADSFSQSQEVMEILDRMSDSIEKAFSNPDTYQRLSIPIALLQQNDFLMVRSSGDEDSHESANAGGNTSEAYVSPNEKEICKAVSRVIQSYFSKRSLLNRLKANPYAFQEDLKLGVTLQKLIGEPVGGAKHPEEIPISFVLFTHEPLYVDVSKEKFRVMRLSATYGHGEGVVGNLGIATDTILILRSESNPDKIYYLYDTQAKNERLIPIKSEDGPIILSKIQNPAELKNRPALRKDQIVSLYTSAILIESFFENHPTDIEGVVKGSSIYFVQARPVNRKPMLPSYLDHPSFTQKAQKTLVIGKASVLIITDPKQVRLAKTLDEAQDGKSPQLVITTGLEAEPENSHPVVNFSGLGIPCLHIPQNEESAQQLLNSIDPEHPLVVCMQTGRIYQWEPSYGNPKDFIKEGFAVHPANIAISISEDVAPSGEEPLNTLSPLHHISNLLDSQNVADIKQALFELDIFLSELRIKIASKEEFDTVPEISKQILILKKLKQEVTHATQEILSVLKTQKERERLPLLFNIKKLKNLIAGPDPSSSPGIGRYSLAHIDHLFDAIEFLQTYQEAATCGSSTTLKPQLLSLLLYGKQGNELAFFAWQKFLLELEPLIAKGKISTKDLEKFTDFIKTLHTLDALPFWMTFFQNDLKATSPLLQFQNILAQIKASNPEMMKQVVKEREHILTLYKQRELFASPHTLPLVWKELQSLLKTYSSKEWLNEIRTTSPIAKIAIYRMMESLVDLIDTAGKQVKSSHQFEGVAHVKQFHEMLFPFNQLMENWAKELIDYSQLKKMLFQSWGDFYFGPIQEIISGITIFQDSELLPSPNFSVSAAKIGSRTNFDRHQPQTLEDLWTLHHQNCLAVLTVLQQNLLSSKQIKDSLLPYTVKSSWQKIEDVSLERNKITDTNHYASRIQPIGMHISKKEIVLQYNVPLKWHSGRLEVQYDFSTQKLTLKGQFLYDTGVKAWFNAKSKWLYAKQWIAALEESGIFTLSRPCVHKEQELTFHLEVPQDRLNLVLDEYLKIADFSLACSFDSCFKNSVEDFFRQNYKFWKTQKEFKEISKHFTNNSSESAIVWNALAIEDTSSNETTTSTTLDPLHEISDDALILPTTPNMCFKEPPSFYQRLFALIGF